MITQPKNITLTTPVRELAGVGPSSGVRLEKLGIRTAKDLIGHTPYRYDDFSIITPIAKLIPGVRTSVRGTVQLIQNKRLFRRHMIVTQALIHDDTASVKAVWFNQPYLVKHLKQGEEVFLAGELTVDKRGPQMLNPTYEKVHGTTIHTARIVPVYHTTSKLTQKQIRFYLSQVLPLANKIPDWLPEDIRRDQGLLPLADAIREIHFPTSSKRLDASQRRLAFNELFLIILTTLRSRRETAVAAAPAIPFREVETRAFIQSLAFTLTPSQKRVTWEILQDMARPHPMNRLLEGDVGSGKTVVATIAMVNAALAGCQAVLMVPTEILARQHYQNLLQMLHPNGYEVALLTRTQAAWSDPAAMSSPRVESLRPRAQGRRVDVERSTSRRALGREVGVETGPNGRAEIARAALKRRIADGSIPILIGTHALIQESVQIPRLGLAIIDEQHRFGVEQRKVLRGKRSETEHAPHLLSMTATPIPRSLALTVYGDLDLSVLTEVPRGRKPIVTKLVPAEQRDRAYAFIREKLRHGEQAFVICPLIDPSDILGVRSVRTEAEKLDNEVFPEFRVGMIHGKLPAEEKERTMHAFRTKQLDVLVATSVIEVGIDIPGATIMLVEDAERFGLAQLHQFRGRIGRNEKQSYCFLFTSKEDEATLARLSEMVKARDGFALAEADLKLRGPGEFWGSRQSGLPSLRFADLADRVFVAGVRRAAAALLDADPDLTRHTDVWRRLAGFHHAIHWE